jgi:hypothetical protein
MDLKNSLLMVGKQREGCRQFIQDNYEIPLPKRQLISFSW